MRDKYPAGRTLLIAIGTTILVVIAILSVMTIFRYTEVISEQMSQAAGNPPTQTTESQDTTRTQE